MKTTKSQVEKAKEEARESYAYHYSLPENQQWKNADNLKKTIAKFQMLTEAYKMGM